MTIPKQGQWTTESPASLPSRAETALNDFSGAASGFFSQLYDQGGQAYQYGRFLFDIKNSIYLSFGPLSIPRNATITEAKLQYTSKQTIATTPPGPNLTPECWLFLLKSDGVWDSSELDSFGSPGAYLLGKPTVDFGISVRVGNIVTGLSLFGTSVKTSPVASLTNTMDTNQNEVVSVGQTFQCDQTVTLGSSANHRMGMTLSKTAAGGGGRFYWYDLYEVTPDAADGQPIAKQGGASHLARTDSADLGFAPTGSPVWGDLPFIAGTSVQITAGKWYMITLRYDWEGDATGVQLVYETVGEPTPGDEATNHGGTFYGMAQNWWNINPQFYQFGFHKTGYPSSGHFTEMSTQDDVPAQFTGKQFGTAIGPFESLADVDEVNLVAEGFAGDSPTATVTGLVSNIQAWIEDFDEYDPASTGRNLTLVLDESGAAKHGAFENNSHELYNSVTAAGDAGKLPTLTIGYEVEGGGEAMRYREVTLQSTVQSRGVDVQGVVRNRRVIIES